MAGESAPARARFALDLEVGATTGLLGFATA